MGHTGNIKASGCHIGGYQDINGAFFKLAHHSVSFLLGQVAMKTFCHVSPLLQGFRHFIASSLGTDEDDGQFRILHIQQAAEGIKFLAVRQFDVFLFDEVDGHSSRFDFHQFRILQESLSQLTDRFRHGGREEEKLPLFRRFIHQSFDIFPETIGQHLIRLIQDYRFHLGKVQTFPPDMVQKAAGCTDNDLGIPFQLLQLVFNGPAADDIYAVKTELQSKGAEYVKYLLGKFPGGGHDEDLGSAPVLIHPLDNRKQVGQGLAGACLGATNQILPLKNGRDGSLLDGGRHFNPLQFQKGCQILCYPKCCKCVHISSCD